MSVVIKGLITINSFKKRESALQIAKDQRDINIPGLVKAVYLILLVPYSQVHKH